jgi:hypothetical protein
MKKIYFVTVIFFEIFWSVNFSLAQNLIPTSGPIQLSINENAFELDAIEISEPTTFTGLRVASVNDNFLSATFLSVNAACISGTTDGNTVESGEVVAPPCAVGNATQTVWYKFTATAAQMYVQLYATAFTGSGASWGPYRWTSVVYTNTGGLPTAGSIISCQNSATQGFGDGIIVNNLSGLTVGATYTIQISYFIGGGINRIPTFCIKVSDQYSTSCTTCATSCGMACGFATTPTVAQVTSTCPNYPYNPYMEGGLSDTRCHSFVANNTTVSFQVIVNSTCGSGNVSGFTWSLYNSSCGGPIQSGTLSNMTFTGLTIGQTYTFCYSFTVPSSCYHTTHYPYFVGAVPLPIELLYFSANKSGKSVKLDWMTLSEINNRAFGIERSSDGKQFEQIASLSGAGNSSTAIEYSWIDSSPLQGITYYRLKQTDYNGVSTYSEIVAVKYQNSVSFQIEPNPATDHLMIQTGGTVMNPIEVDILSQEGKIVRSIMFTEESSSSDGLYIPVSNLEKGIYLIRIKSNNDYRTAKFVKL